MEPGDSIYFDYHSHGGVLEGVSKALHDKWKKTFYVEKQAVTYDHTKTTGAKFRISILYIDGECIGYYFDSWLSMMMFAIWLMKGDPNVTPST